MVWKRFNTAHWTGTFGPDFCYLGNFILGGILISVYIFHNCWNSSPRRWDPAGNTQTNMKRFSLLGVALLVLTVMLTPEVQANEYTKFLGRCQQCTRPIYAYWQPVECTNGCVEYRWVTQRHNHCRPVYKGKKNDFFHSWWMNPANPKRNRARENTCGPFAVSHPGYPQGR